MKNLKRLVTMLGVAAAAMAILEQLQQPEPERTWHGELLGFVPYDFRMPTPRRVIERCWNPEDPRLFTPQVFGVGWTINFYELQKRLMALPRSNGDG
jgi:hypothetical protein